MRLISVLRNTTALAALAWSGAMQADASCVRHFYNKSDFAWSITGYDGTKSVLVIQPHTTVEIPWGAFTTITIGANIDAKPISLQYQVRPLDDCVYIMPQKANNIVTLNKFQGGDVTTCSGGC